MGTVDVPASTPAPPRERAIKYVTKYVTKDLVDQTIVKGDPQKDHLERLHEELAICLLGRCANWLLYGVQPKNAKPALTAAVQGQGSRRRLRLTGRRCLVSRNWSNKTLTDHRRRDHAGRWPAPSPPGCSTRRDVPATTTGAVSTTSSPGVRTRTFPHSGAHLPVHRRPGTGPGNSSNPPANRAVMFRQCPATVHTGPRSVVVSGINRLPQPPAPGAQFPTPY